MLHDNRYAYDIKLHGGVMKANEELGLRIRKIRMVKGMTQTIFATNIGVQGASTISSYESAQNNPPDEVLIKVAELAGISKDDLILGGTAFDNAIGKRASEMDHRKRIRNDIRFNHSPTAGDIETLIDRLDGFKIFIDDVTERLKKGKEQLSLPMLTETEERLLAAFRVLPSSKQRRIVEDTEEWAIAFGQDQSDIVHEAVV